MKKIVILGSGNVTHHLIVAVQNNPKLELVQVYARNPERLQGVVPAALITSDLQDIIMADLYILAISDNGISEIAQNLPFQNRLVAHTSGSSSIQILSEKNRRAVFYPLQTFSKNKKITFQDIPICIEAEEITDLNLLKIVASALSHSVYEINSDQRKALHVAAVFANNFTNHLYHVAETICTENKIDFEILKPLILETSDKIKNLRPKNAQTGPAIRHDTQTIAAHIEFIKNANTKELYKLLTKSIIDNV